LFVNLEIFSRQYLLDFDAM